MKKHSLCSNCNHKKECNHNRKQCIEVDAVSFEKDTAQYKIIYKEYCYSYNRKWR